MQPLKHTIWAAAVAAAVLGGVYIDRAFFSEDAITTSGNKNAKNSAGAAGVASYVLLSDERGGNQQHQDEEADDPYAAAMVPAPYPFEDGRRSVAPSGGGVLENARAVYADISAAILVSARVLFGVASGGCFRCVVRTLITCAGDICATCIIYIASTSGTKTVLVLVLSCCYVAKRDYLISYHTTPVYQQPTGLRTTVQQTACSGTTFVYVKPNVTHNTRFRCRALGSRRYS